MEFCYLMNVRLGGDMNPVRFADCFPQDKRAPEAIALAAAQKYEHYRSESKILYQRLARDYTDTSEGKEAKGKLADWWISYDMDLPLDAGWHGHSILKGQRYRFEIVGERTYDYGGQGILRIDYNDVGLFVGTREELNLVTPHPYMYSGPEIDYDLSRTGSGVARASGFIWFRVLTAGELSGFFTIKLEYKE